jgi:hypothetical protein
MSFEKRGHASRREFSDIIVRRCVEKATKEAGGISSRKLAEKFVISIDECC